MHKLNYIRENTSKPNGGKTMKKRRGKNIELYNISFVSKENMD